MEVPVFYPTEEEFKDFSKYIAKIYDEANKVGLARVVPPKGWTPNEKGYDNIGLDDLTVRTPIKQQVTGARGVYEVLNIEARSMKIRDFKKHAEREIKQLPEKSRGDFAEVERRYWKNVGFSCPMYGADMEGTLFDERDMPWKVATLGTLLDLMKAELPGVSTTYLYFGMWKAMFAWHVEDVDLYSINYLHFGAPKSWYCVPTEHHDKLERLARSLFPERAYACPEFLRHKTMVISPEILRKNNVPYGKTTQEAGQFMITFPLAYHAGFNHGFNCAESTNFALPNWLKFGLKAKFCKCRPDTVRINMVSLMNRLRTEGSQWMAGEYDLGIGGDPADPAGAGSVRKRKSALQDDKGGSSLSKTSKKGRTLTDKDGKEFWHFSCLCGASDMVTSFDSAYRHPKGEMVKCTKCERSSHVACYPAFNLQWKKVATPAAKKSLAATFVCKPCEAAGPERDQGWKFRCICGLSEGVSHLYPRKQWPAGRLFECSRCKRWAHIDCYQHYTSEKKTPLEMFCNRCDDETNPDYWTFSCKCGKHEGVTGLDPPSKQPKGRLFECSFCSKWGHVGCYADLAEVTAGADEGSWEEKLPPRCMCYKCESALCTNSD